jgi:hypothetical protein
MTPNDFAAILGGTYPFDLTRDQNAEAQAHGLVVVFGASDDLMEFRGSIVDEFGCYGGDIAYVDPKGMLPERDQIEDDDTLRDYFARQPRAVGIEALWASEGDYSWTYRTEIPHATFEITEDGEPYCRGLVFSLASLTDGSTR